MARFLGEPDTNHKEREEARRRGGSDRGGLIGLGIIEKLIKTSNRHEQTIEKYLIILKTTKITHNTYRPMNTSQTLYKYFKQNIGKH